LNASAFLLTFRQNAASSAGISTSIVSVSKAYNRSSPYTPFIVTSQKSPMTLKIEQDSDGRKSISVERSTKIGASRRTQGTTVGGEPELLDLRGTPVA